MQETPGDDAGQPGGRVSRGREAEPFVGGAHSIAGSIAAGADVAETSAAVAQDKPQLRAIRSGLGDLPVRRFNTSSLGVSGLRLSVIREPPSFRYTRDMVVFSL